MKLLVYCSLNLCYYYFITALAHLSVDAALDGPAVYGDVFLFEIQSVAFGHPDHLLHQVQPSNTLSYGMLHLSGEPGKMRMATTRADNHKLASQVYMLQICV